MADSDENDDLSSAGDSELPEPLIRWERVSALVIGSVCGGAGGYAVFERSNQVGAAMLLILAAIFLLIGVQGTPLIRFGSSSGSVELERRRKRKVRQALEEAKEENNAEKVEGIMEGVKLIAPDLVPNSFEGYTHYENSVADAIRKMGYSVWHMPTQKFTADLEIINNGRTVYAEVKYYNRPIQTGVLHQVIGLATLLSAPVLLIASTKLTQAAQAVADNGNVNFVQWRNEIDSSKLRATVERLFAEVGNNDGGASAPNDTV
jgi:hypothetical protein